MNAKIAIVAPFSDLYQTAEEVVKEQAGNWSERVMVVQGDLEAGVIAAKQAMGCGAEVIISRSGTALLIARELDVPVVEIRVTILDILRALSKVQYKAGIVGIVGFRNAIYAGENLGKLFGMPLRVISLDNPGEVRRKIVTAAKEGVTLIIGDFIAVRLAAEIGLEGILIQSGKETISQAISDARLVMRTRRKEQERAELLRSIINNSKDGIVSIDAQDCITIFNPMAEEIFQTKATSIIGHPVTEVIPDAHLPQIGQEDVPEQGGIRHVGGKVIVTKRIPIMLGKEMVGAVVNLQDVTQMHRLEQAVRQKICAKGLVAKMSIDDIIGVSPAILLAKERTRQYGATGSTVLITGESGTGKEMFAQSVHNVSKRKNGSFVSVNCAALPENLLESELFGYEEGAFTGARKGGKAGLFELAHNGTLFLDEIGEMNLALQSKLLRVLQEREVMRLGGESLIPVDVRIISATNRNLNELIAHRQFRQDLYYRLDILHLHVPPLRERIPDIALLAEYFVDKFSRLHGKYAKITGGAVRILERYHWPGNVRELVNILERAVLMATRDTIEESCIREVLLCNGDMTQSELEMLAADNLASLEHQTISRILAEEGFNYTKTAARLGINRTTLWRKLHKKE